MGRHTRCPLSGVCSVRVCGGEGGEEWEERGPQSRRVNEWMKEVPSDRKSAAGKVKASPILGWKVTLRKQHQMTPE